MTNKWAEYNREQLLKVVGELMREGEELRMGNEMQAQLIQQLQRELAQAREAHDE